LDATIIRVPIGYGFVRIVTKLEIVVPIRRFSRL
jgi:hypothetical protein